MEKGGHIGGISIKVAKVDEVNEVKEALQLQNSINSQTSKLNQLQLEQLWNETVEHIAAKDAMLAGHLREAKVRMEEDDNFSVEVVSNFAQSEIKPHLLRILTYMRTRCGCPKLNCHIEVVYVEREAVAYTPRDKYDVMLATNPILATFKVIFPDVDY